jgi:hypothetical protein
MSVIDEIAACIDEPGIELVWVQGSVGSGKTSLVTSLAEREAAVGHPVAIMCPTKDLALARHAAKRGRDGVEKIHFIGSNDLISRPFRTVFADDAEKFRFNRMGDPLLLALFRVKTYQQGKVFAFSSEPMPDWMRSRQHRKFVLQ